jgi:hypothetical protein
MRWHAGSLQLLLLLLLLPSQSAKLRTPGLLGPAAAAAAVSTCSVPNIIGLLAALVLALASAAVGVTTASAADLPSSASRSSCAEVLTAHAM